MTLSITLYLPQLETRLQTETVRGEYILQKEYFFTRTAFLMCNQLSMHNGIDNLLHHFSIVTANLTEMMKLHN